MMDYLPPRVFSGEGREGDMVNLIFVAQEKQLQDAFRRAGWVQTDKWNPLFVWHLMQHGTSDAHVPMARFYLFGRVQDYSYALPDPQAIVSRRHHLRIWKTDYTENGTPIWVGSATHDVAIEIAKNGRLINHRIDPEVDDERDFIGGDLTADRIGQQPGICQWRESCLRSPDRFRRGLPLRQPHPSSGSAGADFNHCSRAASIGARGARDFAAFARGIDQFRQQPDCSALIPFASYPWVAGFRHIRLSCGSVGILPAAFALALPPAATRAKLLDIVFAKRHRHFIERGEETMTRRAIAIFMLLASLSFAASSLLAAQDNNADDKWQAKGNYEYRVYRLRPTDWPQGTKQPGRPAERRRPAPPRMTASPFSGRAATSTTTPAKVARFTRAAASPSLSLSPRSAVTTSASLVTTTQHSAAVLLGHGLADLR